MVINSLFSWLAVWQQQVSCYSPLGWITLKTNSTVLPIYFKASPVLGPARKFRGLFVPRAIVEQLLQEPGGLNNFTGLDFLGFTRGPLATAAGDQIEKTGAI